MPKLGSGGVLACSFCGKTQHQVVKLIAGPGVYICDQCVDLSVRIIDEEVGERQAPRRNSEVDDAARAAWDAIDRLRALAQQAPPAEPE